jgi:hypothetical protein
MQDCHAVRTTVSVAQACADGGHATLQAFETQLPQTGGDSSVISLQGLLEAAEPAGAAANVLVFLLLKASPADQLPQVCNHSLP